MKMINREKLAFGISAILWIVVIVQLTACGTQTESLTPFEFKVDTVQWYGENPDNFDHSTIWSNDLPFGFIVQNAQGLGNKIKVGQTVLVYVLSSQVDNEQYLVIQELFIKAD